MNSAARLSARQTLWLCVPASRQVCSFGSTMILHFEDFVWKLSQIRWVFLLNETLKSDLISTKPLVLAHQNGTDLVISFVYRIRY